MDVKLDKETFKALSNSTRIDLLKLLQRRRHMQAELASSLDLAVPTVKQHLEMLEKAELVKRHDEGRKWKYYSLTPKAKAVLQPEQTKIWIILGTFILAVAGTLLTWPKQVFRAAVEPAPMMLKMESDAVNAAAQAVPKAAEVSRDLPVPWHLVFMLIATIALFPLIYYSIRQYVYKKNLGKRLTKK